MTDKTHLKLNNLNQTELTVTVEISKLLMLRVWIAVKLIQLASLVAGFDFQIANGEV